MHCVEINGLSVHKAGEMNSLGIQHCIDCRKALLPVNYGEMLPKETGIYRRNVLGILQLASADEESLLEFETVWQTV